MDEFNECLKQLRLRGYDFKVIDRMYEISALTGISFKQVDNPKGYSDWDWFSLEINGSLVTIMI